MRISFRNGRGLTLLELLLAVAIIGILTSLAYPAYTDFIRRSKVADAASDIREIEQRVERYYLNQKALPASLADIGGAPIDPWGNPYQYLNIQDSNNNGKVRKDKNLVPLNTDYDLYSTGEDGQSQSPLTAKSSRDDIVRASNGRFVGLATDY